MWKAIEERISGPVILEKEVRIRIGVNQNRTSNLGILLQMRWQPKKKSLSSRPSCSLRPQTLYKTKFSGLSWCTGTRGNSYCFHIHTWSCDAFVNVSFLCVPVHEDTTKFSAPSMSSYWRTELYLIHLFLDKVRKRSVFKLPALRIQPFTRRTIPVTRDIPMIRKCFPPPFEVFINLEPRVTAAWLAGVLIRDRWLLNSNTHLKSRAQGYFGSLSAVRSPGIGRYVMYGELCMTYFGK